MGGVAVIVDGSFPGVAWSANSFQDGNRKLERERRNKKGEKRKKDGGNGRLEMVERKKREGGLHGEV